MIVWINGAFGGGKTHTAYELVRRTDGTVLVDPEVIGFGLQRSLPGPLRVDFQEMPSWRSGVIELLDRVERSDRYRATVVPMTLVDPEVVAQIHGGLAERGHEIRHVALIASRATIRRRLRLRAAGITRWETWAMSQLDRCLDALAEMDVHRIDNDTARLDDVVERVAEHADLPLTRPALPRWQQPLRRLQVAAAVLR